MDAIMVSRGLPQAASLTRIGFATGLGPVITPEFWARAARFTTAYRTPYWVLPHRARLALYSLARWWRGRPPCSTCW